MKINNYNELLNYVEEYKKKFPETYTTLERIKNVLQNDFNNTGGGGLFGIQVSPEWEDRCYGFQYLTTTSAGEPVYQFVGMTKS